MASPRRLPGQISDIDLRLLRVYRTVVEAGGFAQAEVELNVSTSAISISMADLEKRLGLRLCQRGRAGFSLTDEGRQVYEASLQLFTSLETFRTDIHAIHQQLRGELAIGITDNLVTSPKMRVTNALRMLKKQGPDVHIRIRMIPPGEVEQGLLDGRLNVGVVPMIAPLKGLHYQPLYNEHSLLYCNHAHPLFNVDEQQIDETLLRQYEAVDPIFAVTPEIREQYLKLNTTASASDREGIAFLIMTGLYIGFLPDHYAHSWVENDHMRALCPQQYSQIVRYAVVTRKGVRPNLVLETFLDALQHQPEKPC
ncbi:MAG: LysR family transcriptional regulator [Marinobacterium sp.]|nr:LysR family transcriptional regulator [Marinobacterium sp.]